MPDNRNFILAIALSLAVLLGWSYFISGPAIEQQRVEQEQAAQETTAEAGGGERAAADSIAIPGSRSGTRVAEGALPIRATDDALHLAVCAYHGVDYLLTWNCRHLTLPGVLRKCRTKVTSFSVKTNDKMAKKRLA